jgi:hypothetical protein
MHKRKREESKIEQGLTKCGTHKFTVTPAVLYRHVALKIGYIKKDIEK